MRPRRVHAFGLEDAQSWLLAFVLRVSRLHIHKRWFVVLPLVDLLDSILQSQRDMSRRVTRVDECAISTSTDELDWEGFGHLQNSTFSSALCSRYALTFRSFVLNNSASSAVKAHNGCSHTSLL
jgi:hypothetical protein